MKRSELIQIIKEEVQKIISEKKFKYATIKRGKVKVKSKKQLALLHARGLPHTDVYKSKSGKTYKKRDESIVKESPDSAGESLDFRDTDAIPFYIINNRAFIATEGHGAGNKSILTHFDVNKSYTDVDLPRDREDIGTSGRFWTNSKTISFWKIEKNHQKNFFQIINKEIKRQTAEKIAKKPLPLITKDWLIDFCDLHIYAKLDDFSANKFFKISEYISGNVDDTKYEISWDKAEEFVDWYGERDIEE